MGKPFAIVALVAFAFCFSSVLGRKGKAHLDEVIDRNPPAFDKFFVEGKIYCDPCQFEFESRLSRPLSGVKVILQCRKPDTDSLTFSLEGNTDANGIYSLPIEGDHQDEICEVKTEESAHLDCKIPMANIEEANRIVLTKNNGVSSSRRFVNPLGFKTVGIDAACSAVAKELELDTINN